MGVERECVALSPVSIRRARRKLHRKVQGITSIPYSELEFARAAKAAGRNYDKAAACYDHTDQVFDWLVKRRHTMPGFLRDSRIRNDVVIRQAIQAAWQVVANLRAVPDFTAERLFDLRKLMAS